MCTVTIVPHERGVRLVCNRDERRSRPPALPPKLIRVSERRAIFPIDPAGGGTWIGANDTGLVLTLLNRSEGCTRRPAADEWSRGLIVRTLIECASLDAVVSALETLDVSRFAPFRLVAMQNVRVAVVTGDGCTTASQIEPLTRPLLFTSSSLGDALVEQPRRELFDRLVVSRPAARLQGQARFHRHRWTARPDISVLMSRHDAMTVSRTVVDLTERRSTMLYEPMASGNIRKIQIWCSSR